MNSFLKKIVFGFCIIGFLPLIGQTDSCLCQRGIGSKNGDAPKLVHSFNNGISLAVCGWVNPGVTHEDLFISEFSVFDCRTGDWYARYYALDYCKVVSEGDSLIIFEMKTMPSNNNWEWETMAFRKRIFYEKDNVVWHGLVPCFIQDSLSKRFVSKSLKDLEKFRGTSDYEEESQLIGRLEYLTLNGSEIAKKRLFNLEEYYNVKTNAASSEHWHDAMKTVTWMVQMDAL